VVCACGVVCVCVVCACGVCVVCVCVFGVCVCLVCVCACVVCVVWGGCVCVVCVVFVVCVFVLCVCVCVCVHCFNQLTDFRETYVMKVMPLDDIPKPLQCAIDKCVADAHISEAR
jgi:hypothetical protein